MNTIASLKYAACVGVSMCAFLIPTHSAYSADTDQDKVAANFRLADTNSDNALSTDEFRAFIDLNAASNLGRAGMVKRAGAYGTAFSRADANGDGMVTPAELQGL